jgi:hypothetical protein
MDSNNWLSSPEWLPVPLIAGLLAVTAFIAIVAVVRQARARSARRWKDLLEAYAQREIVREGRRMARRKLRALSGPRSILAGPRATTVYPLQPQIRESESSLEAPPRRALRR